MNVVAPPQSGVPLASDENLFDSLFGSEQSLLNLLVAIRSADIDEDEKLELRDLVLEYAQLTDAEKRESVKKQLDNLLKKNSTIVDTALKNRVSVRSANTTSPVSATTIDNVIKPVSVRPKIAAGRLNPVFKVTAKAQVVSKPSVNEIKISTPQTPPTAITEVKAVSQTPSALPEIQNESPAQSVSTSTMAPHVTNPMERISEIKRLVNSKVGNPINLIDSDNNVGREYMNALLDAMKKSSGSGLAGELDVAMARLETAYLAVENHIAGHSELLVSHADTQAAHANTENLTSNKIASSKEPLPETVAAVEIPPEPVVINEAVVNSELSKPQPEIKEVDLPIPEEIKKPEPKTSGAGLVQEPEEDFRDVALAPPKPSALSSLASKLFVDRSQTGAVGPSSNKTKITPLKEKMVSSTPEVSALTSVPVVAKTSKPSIRELAKEATLTPVSKDSSVTEKITSFREEMKKRDADDKLPVTELSAPEVTAGLNQLLSEWKLFKSSGFLGTGPSGINHPLYLKLKPMPMASVIAGRFEGANPEIKQSITDYMNGWRYEQGLVHEMGETFEHYLRRVILHILERQTEVPKA